MKYYFFFQNTCTVSLFHTPKLRGIYKKTIPDKYNELIGLQHCKLFVFDDSVIISGANLSSDYFTNRQDRYILIGIRSVSYTHLTLPTILLV